MSDVLWETDFCKVRVKWVVGLPFIHCDVYKWSPSIYREMKKEWPAILKAFSDNGVHTVFSCVPSSDSLVNKWQVMWGMNKEVEADGHILYSCLTEEL